MRRINFGNKLLDERWQPSDQLINLKGIVEFHERYKYWLELKDEIKIDEREEELKRISESVKQLRNLLKKHEVADYEAIEEVLKQDREIYLICRGEKPQDIIENLKQMIFRKKLAVDKTFFEVKKKEEELCDIESKIAMCKEQITQEEELVKNKETEEREKYCAALEYAETQKDVCRITLDSHNKLLGILKKDSYYFDDLLDMLKEDQLVQSNAILSMLTLGQMLTEDFAWLNDEAKKHAITFNNQTKQVRKELRSLSQDIRQLETIKKKIMDYAAHDYPLFQVVEYPEKEEHPELRNIKDDLDEFKEEWRKCLNVTHGHEFLPKLIKLYGTQDELLKRMHNINALREFEEQKCFQLETVLAELENGIDDNVRKNLKSNLDLENEINTIAEEMQDLKKQEDEINKDMGEYKDIMYQFRRLLRQVNIGPALKSGDNEEDQAAMNKLRFDNVSFHLSSESEEEEKGKTEEDIEKLARNYLDPNIMLDEKSSDKDEVVDSDECDPIKLFDNVMMQMKTILETIGPEEMSRDIKEEELNGLGDFYSERQDEMDPLVKECMELEKLNYKKYKPRYDDHAHKKNCPNSSRLEMKTANQRIVFQNEGPVVGVVTKKGALHPPGVIRGMFIPESESEEEEEKEEEKDTKQDQKKGDDDEEEIEEELQEMSSSTSQEEALDSDLEPNLPKPHICF